MVFFAGKIKFVSSPATPLTLFTLPAGYIPGSSNNGDGAAFTVAVFHPVGNKTTGHLHISAAGVVTVDGFNPSNGDYLHLWQVSFFAEN